MTRNGAAAPSAASIIAIQKNAMMPVPALTAPNVIAVPHREAFEDNGTTSRLQTSAPTMPGTMHDQKAASAEAH